MRDYDKPQFPMGLKWTGTGAAQKDRTYHLVEYLVTRNMTGDIVKARYCALYKYMGRVRIDDDIVAVTRQRAIADGRCLNPEIIDATPVKLPA